MAALAIRPKDHHTRLSPSVQLCAPNLAKTVLGGSFPLEVITLHGASKEWKVSKHGTILLPPDHPDEAWYGKRTGQGVSRFLGLFSVD